MYLLNRVSLIGRLKDNPRCVFTGNNQSVMTFGLDTCVYESHRPFSNHQHQDHQILIENPSMIQYAQTYLKSGDLVYVEGRLEYVRHEKEKSETLVVISEDYGFLHPLANVRCTSTSSGRCEDAKHQKAISL